jgi:hypothetical protein
MKTPQSRLLQLVAACAFALFILRPSAVAAGFSPAPAALKGGATSGDQTEQGASVPPRVTEVVDPEKLVVLQGNTHPLARPEFDRGAVADGQPIRRMLLVLQRSPEQEAELRHLLDEQQTKSSPNFHHWLTPQEFGQRFGPADADIQAVTDWLTSQGFQVSRVAAGRTVIEFSGTAGQVRQAFHTEIHKFALDGEEHFANTSDPQIPAALTPVVKGFASLNNFPRKPMIRRLGTFQRSKATGEVRPLFTFTTSVGTAYGVGPYDFATIYNVLPLWNAGTDGTGQTIAIVGQTNINCQDVADFRTMFGLPYTATSSTNPCPTTLNVILNGPDPGLTSDEPEGDLDVQWSGAVAKGATIDFVVSESTESSAGIDLSALYVIDNNLAPVMSESYGSCELFLGNSGNQFYSSLWEQASAEGITVMISAGDSGSAGCDPYQPNQVAADFGVMVNGIASTPFNVAVGGTSFNDTSALSTYWSAANTSTTQSSALSYIPESTWNDTCARTGVLTNCSSPASDGTDLVGGSGGPSNCASSTSTSTTYNCINGYVKPSWQSGTGVPSDGVRDTPDVSLFASDGFIDGSFYIICELDSTSATGGSATSCDLNPPFTDFLGVGGTSGASPAFAGMMAMVNQKYGRQGNANYVLYKLAAQGGASCTSNSSAVSNSSCIFYDINNTTSSGNQSNNSVACDSTAPYCSNQTGSGYGILVTSSTGSSSTPAWTTGAGYDYATGLGTVNAANLVTKWSTVTFTPSATTISSVTPSSSSTSPIPHGSSVTFAIQVASGTGSGTPTGDVSLIAQANGNSALSSTGIGPFTLSSGAVSAATNQLPAGTYNVTAHYTGDGTFGASDSPAVSVTVGKENSVAALHLLTFDSSGNLTSTTATSVTYGSSYVFRLDVTNSSGNLCAPSPPFATSGNGAVVYPCPTGTVTVTDNGSTIPVSDEEGAPVGYTPGVYKLNSQGYLEDQYIQFPAGSHSLVATYGGDNSYNTSSATYPVITVSQAATATGVAAPASASAGENVTLTALVETVSDGFGPTGTITFFNNGIAIGSPVTVTPTAFSSATGLFASATASLITSFTANASITATYSGDPNYTGSTSGAAPITVTATPDFNFSASPLSPSSTVMPGGSATSTLTIAPLNGFTGAVTLTCSSSPSLPGGDCSASPSPVTVSSSSSVTSTLTITTTANVPPRMREAPERRVPPSPAPYGTGPSFRLKVGLPWLAAWLLALLLAVGALSERRKWSPVRDRRYGVATLAATLLVVGIWAACGGGGSSGPPPAPAVSLSTTSLSFGTQGVNTTSTAESVTLSNSGNATLSITAFALSGTNPGDFNQTNTCGTSVAAGAACTISVTFTPSATGTRTAALGITDNAAGSPQTISLTGTGASATPAGNYTLTVTATGPSGSPSHSVTIPLTVQ